MARLHTKKKGKSGSHKPAARISPAWVKHSREEIWGLIEKMAREGKTPAAIGQLLRDEHGIPSVRALTKKKLVAVLKEKNLAGNHPQDMIDLMRRAVRVAKHLKANPRDTSNKIKLSNIEAKIKRRGKYYSSKGILPKGWKYDAEQAFLLVK
ncbi:MAG: 30S ribosomal protein S15 [Candidatus Micrarchaeota archaeon]|nr:30S ribosomal protein S15 [Candidatus Micrarchaeota archaeon]